MRQGEGGVGESRKGVGASVGKEEIKGVGVEEGGKTECEMG